METAALNLRPHTLRQFGLMDFKVILRPSFQDYIDSLLYAGAAAVSFRATRLSQPFAVAATTVLVALRGQRE